jgi:hypothetical protein
MKRLRLIGSILYYLGFIVLMCQILLWIDPSMMDTAQGRMGSVVLMFFGLIPFMALSEGCEGRGYLLDIILGEKK